MVSSFCYQRLTHFLPAHASLFYDARFIVFSVLCETKAYKYTLIKVCSSMLCRLLKSISFVFQWKHVMSMLSPLSLKSWRVLRTILLQTVIVILSIYLLYWKDYNQNKEKLLRWWDFFSRCHFHLSRTKMMCEVDVWFLRGTVDEGR